MTFLEKLEQKHPTIFGIVMLIGFILGCTAVWGLAVLANFLIGRL